MGVRGFDDWGLVLGCYPEDGSMIALDQQVWVVVGFACVVLPMMLLTGRV